ncbi:polysaccharide deacetylase family protein [Candidatus Saccharibacteria bacterium]|nr:polysaccharide deacetylase family protein [Candidatus Saccharibacteria bacterium]
MDRITKESYERILKGLLENPKGKVTFNINGVLFDLWHEFGHGRVIETVGELLERGQIELTGSAKFHPLLPKLPEDEIKRQVELNTKTLKEYLGEKTYEPKGFFPPEMAYDTNVAQVASEMGFSWIIVEELSFLEGGKVDYSRIYQEKGTKLSVFFREREISYKILSGQLGTEKLFLDEIKERFKKEQYLLTAMDGETFGHHRPGMDRALMSLLNLEEVQTVLLSDLPEHFPQVEVVETRPSTWALMEKDLEKKVPFARWDDPDNPIHKLQWELTELAIETVRDSKNPQEARDMLDRALHSDQYWWASARPWWSLEMIERGAFELKETVLSVSDASDGAKKRAKELYFRIITSGFEWQRSGKVEEIARSEDEEIRMRTDAGMGDLPKEEIEKMIKHIKQEMDEVAKNQEYERAALLRDRIRELRSYIK